MRLVIASSVIHFKWQGALYAYGPYVKEIRVWADLVDRVTIAAPCREVEPRGDCLPFERGNIALWPLPEAGGTTLWAKLSYGWKLPALACRLTQVFRQADAIHVRCPGNVGLLAALLSPLFSDRLVAKYAGQWEGYPSEPPTMRFQRWLLSSRWWRGPVTVYGEWPNQPRNIVPFFTSILDGQQIKAARTAARAPRTDGPLRVLYVGRLTRQKHVEKLITAVSRLSESNIACDCRIIGTGPEDSVLRELTSTLGAGDRVTFLGAVDHERVLEELRAAHVLVLVSESEGWPKAITEAMAFGVVCVGSNRGLVPRLLAGGRGFVVPPGDADALTETLRLLAGDRALVTQVARKAAPWAQRYSLEGLRTAIGELLTERWGVPLSHPSVGSKE